MCGILLEDFMKKSYLQMYIHLLLDIRRKSLKETLPAIQS